MRRVVFPVFIAAVLAAGCGNKPPTPDWQMNAHDSLQRAGVAWLNGDTRIEAAEFARARSAVARTGRADLLARVELARCAWRVASLDFAECAGYVALAADAAAPERAYAAYLAGTATPADAALLPEAHRGVPAGGAEAVARIEDPLARLVAAGVVMRSGKATPALLGLASDTASAQGWRRPLVAWLEVQARRAADAGQADEAARLQRRIALVAGPAAAKAATAASAAAAASAPAPAREASYASAFRTLRTLDCARCHGRDHEGPAAPSLVDYARTATREQFAAAVLEGNAGRGMPPYRTNELAVATVGDLYAYFKARADGTLARDWRP
jgi:Cytochrome C oxidase, cbb3-type, subunit III